MFRRKYFIERKYLNIALFFSAVAVVLAVISSPTDDKREEMTVVDRLEQCQRAMTGPGTDRMERERKHCLEFFSSLGNLQRSPWTQ